MKKLLLLVAFSFALPSAYSQNESIENTTWLNARWQFNTSGTQSWLSRVHEISTTTDDTLINAQNYLKLYRGGYIGALRVDSTRWYFCAADSSQEMLLYDFGLQPGDTLTEKIYVDDRTYVDSLICVYVQTQTYNGVPRKLVEFKAGGGNQLGSNYLYRGEWIDGIGNPQGMLVEFYQNISQYALDLACFSINDTVLYTGGTYYPSSNTTTVGCDASFSTQEDKPNQQLKIYPNPAQNHLWVAWGAFSGSYTAEVLDFDGRLLGTHQVNQAKARIDLALAPGLYVLRCRDGKSVSNKIFLVRP